MPKMIMTRLGVVLLLSVALPAVAQNGSAAPQGSYLKTCSQIHFDGAILTATCAAGGPIGYPALKKASIDVTSCEGTPQRLTRATFLDKGGPLNIWNNKGVLYCYVSPDLVLNGFWGQGTTIPHGGYVDSCSLPLVSVTILKTQCKGRNGQYNDTSLELKTCRSNSNISNIDGQLVCIN